MSCYTREQIEATMASKGYKYFTGGDYDVNIIGVRNSKTKGRVTNAFDDCLTLSYKVDGEWQFHCFKCTTDPGSHWEQNLLNKNVNIIPKPPILIRYFLLIFRVSGISKIRNFKPILLTLGIKNKHTKYEKPKNIIPLKKVT